MAAPSENLLRASSEPRLDRAPMAQSRETGDVLPNSVPQSASPFAKSWVHFVAGG